MAVWFPATLAIASCLLYSIEHSLGCTFICPENEKICHCPDVKPKPTPDPSSTTIRTTCEGLNAYCSVGGECKPTEKDCPDGKKERSPASVGRPALCNLNYEPGDCDAAFPMFFFNKDKGVCEKFTWGGCGGNLNKFEKKEDCEKTCIALVGYGDTKPTKLKEFGKQCEPGKITECPSDKCNTGHCNKGCHALTCTFIGCPSRTKGEHELCYIDRNNCEKGLKCTKQDDGCNNGVGRCVKSGKTLQSRLPRHPRCEHELNHGHCQASIPIYYFNTKTEDCEKSYYGGCGGNSNRFHTLEKCKQYCIVDI